MANIRKILRQREKERLFVNKTPTFEKNKDDALMEKIMIHIKAMDTNYTNEFGTPKKVDKFDIFLSNLKSSQSVPFGLKPVTRSVNIRPSKSNCLEILTNQKALKDEFLPRIS